MAKFNAKLSNCVKTAGKFTPSEIAKLDDAAAAYGEDTDAYIAAVQDAIASTEAMMGLIREQAQAAAALAPTAESSVQGARPARRVSKVELADMQEIDSAVERYEGARKQKDADEAARWLYDEARENESPRVREYARQKFEEAVDPITREGIERTSNNNAGRKSSWNHFVETNTETAALPDSLDSAPGQDNAIPASELKYDNWALTPEESQIVGGALADVQQSPAGKLMSVAAKMIDGVVGMQHREGEHYAAAITGGRWGQAYIGFTRLLLDSLAANADGAKADLRLTLAHELTHVVDAKAAEGTSRFASDSETSPVYSDGTTHGPVMQEALDYFARGGGNESITAALEYAIVRLAFGDKSAGVFGRRELTPRLIELYYNDADTLEAELPQAHAFVKALVEAPNFTAIKDTFNGRRAASSDERVQGSVRVLPADRSANDSGSISGSNRQIGARGRSGASPAPAGAGSGGGSDGTGRLEFSIPEPDESGRMGHALNTIKGALTNWRNLPGALGWLSLRQIADRFQAYPSVKRFVGASLQMGQRAEQIMGEVNNALKPWRNLQADTQRQLGKVMLEATMEQVHVDQSWDSEANAHLRVEDPDLRASNRRTYERLRAAYVALPERATQVYKQVRETGKKQWGALAEARATDIMRAYKQDLAPIFSDEELRKLVADKKERDRIASQLKSMPMTVTQRAATKRLIEHAETNFMEQVAMKGPYFPLVRHGDHVVVAKSNDFNSAADAYRASRDKLQALYDREPPTTEAEERQLDTDIKAARGEMQAAKTRLDALKTSEQHYLVSFFEHDWEAQAYKRKLDADPDVQKASLSTKVEQRAQHEQRFDGASPQFVRKLEDELVRSLGKADSSAVRNAVREIYLRAAPDRSALKSELRRLNVPGAKSTEMMRGFAARSMGNAFRISRMEFGGDLQDALAEMKASDSRDEVLVANELQARMLSAFTPPQQNMVIDSLAQMAHLTYLGLSPSYLLINATQPWVISAPMMAARHGWSRASKALGDASLEVMANVRTLRAEESKRLADAGDRLASVKSWRFDIQPEQLGKTDAERRMLRELFNGGLINITIEHDLGAVSRGANQTPLGMASEFASTPAHVIEIVNRVSTALAAFRLQQQADRNFQRSVDYATQVVADTHFDYSAENAPRLMRSESLGGLGRLVWQFKKYMQGMIFLIGKLSKESLAGDKEAQKGLAYLIGMTVGVSGAVGLPIAGGVGVVFKALSQLWEDDDEPEIGQMLYNGLQDVLGETGARLVAKGLPAAVGVDLSGRMGLGSLTNPLQFAQTGGKEGKDLYGSLLVAALGPASGMLANWFDAASLASTDPVRAWGAVLPKVFKDPLMAMDRTDRGITSRSGDPLVGEDEFGLLRTLMKGAGFESTDVTDMFDNRSAFQSAKGRADNARRKLIRAYTEARKAGEPTGEIMDDIAGFNRRNPDNRITMVTLQRGLQARQQAAQQTRQGIRLRPQDAGVLDQLGLNEEDLDQ
ncbi:MAG: PLxRFG domain-containing protein [Betaproteobacteria bacterium]